MTPYIVGEWVTLPARAETEEIVFRIENECISCYETAEVEKTVEHAAHDKTQHSHVAALLSKAWFAAYVDDKDDNDDDDDDNNNNNKTNCPGNFYSTKCIITLVIHVSVN